MLPMTTWRPSRRPPIARSLPRLGAVWAGVLLGVSVLGAACDRGKAEASVSTPTTVEPQPEPQPEVLAKVQLDTALWGSTCAEDLASWADAGPPPPPPPQPQPDDLPSAPLVPPATGPAPARYAKMPRSWRSDLPARLGLSERACDPEALVRLHQEHPQEESLYCAIAFAYEECGQLEQAMAWAEKRVASFPESIDARLAVAVRRFLPLEPDRESGLGHNEQLAAADRLAIATQVLADVEGVLSQRPTDVTALQLASQAHIQQAYAYGLYDDAPEHALRALLARKVLVEAWTRTQAIAEIQGWPSCDAPEAVEAERCLPRPPLTEEELRADAELEARLRTGAR